MRSRHQRNSSLLQEHAKNTITTHHRSFSYTRYAIQRGRHQRNVNHMHPKNQSPDHFPTETFTQPLSIELNRQTKYRQKKAQKDFAKQFGREKKNTKSKQKEQILRKKREEKVDPKSKKSNERGQNKMKTGSKEWMKRKNSPEKSKEPSSTQKRQNRSNEFKKIHNDKLHKNSMTTSKEKKQSKLESQSLNWNWEELIKRYGHYLTIEEIAQIKEYKWIFYIGKIAERKKQQMKPLQDQPLASAREAVRQREVNVYQTISEQCDVPDSKKCENQDEFYKYEIGDHIAYRYEIIESINQGSFGEVLKVFDHKTKEFLALKITKRSQELVQQTFLQITILTQIREKDKSNLSGVVRIKDFTIFRNHICMVFELLDGNLYELLVANHYNGLSEDVVRIFAVQILNSLNFLQKERVIHCDIKPENIVMKTWGKSGIKLVDFGTSCFEGKQIYEYLQSRYYRAPQIIFKKRYSYPIDMWSFGCLIAELKIGEPIFAGSSNVEQLLYIINSIGLPNESQGPYSKDFLRSREMEQIVSLDYLDTYARMKEKGEDLSGHRFFSQCKYIKTCMKSLEQRLKESKGFSSQDKSFYSFLMKILVWQPEKRLKPQEALQDSWITKGLPSQIKELYTIFNSAEYSKRRSKPKNSKDSKTKTKPRSTSKKSKEKGKVQNHSGEERRDSFFNGRPKQTVFDSKVYRYNSRVNSSELMNQ